MKVMIIYSSTFQLLSTYNEQWIWQEMTGLHDAVAKLSAIWLVGKAEFTYGLVRAAAQGPQDYRGPHHLKKTWGGVAVNICNEGPQNSISPWASYDLIPALLVGIQFVSQYQLLPWNVLMSRG